VFGIFLMRSVGNVYVFHGKEEDVSKPQYHDDKVVVLAFKSAESEFLFLSVKNDSDVELQVVVLLFR